MSWLESWISSVTSYKENGMSWTFDRAGVSQALLDRLPRNIGINKVGAI